MALLPQCCLRAACSWDAASCHAPASLTGGTAWQKRHSGSGTSCICTWASPVSLLYVATT
jgi:hypothetical protein